MGCNITSITISELITTVGSGAFDYWKNSQTINVPFKEGEEPEGWSEDWNYCCTATINYQK